MKRTPISFSTLFPLFLLLAVGQATGAALGTAFSYSGRLADAGGPATGIYDFQFILYDAANGGAQQGGIVTQGDVPVTNGLFTVELDFGASVFAGDARWLEVGVRAGASSDFYTVLSPRQAILPTPYALHAFGFTGPVQDAQLSANVPRLNAPNLFLTGAQTITTGADATKGLIVKANSAGQSANLQEWQDHLGTPVASVSPSGVFAGNGSSLTSLNAGSLSSGTLPNARLSGTYSAGLNFNNPANSFVGAFSGSGMGLTDLNASSLSSGTLPDVRLSANVALRNADQTFQGTNIFSGVLCATNSANKVTGVFTGDGKGLTNLSASSLSSGTVPEARIDALIARDSEILPTLLSSDGTGSGVDADFLDGLNASAFWQLAGNAGTTPGADFVGTRDNRPLEFKVSSARALRLEPHTNGPNIIGGSAVNFVAPGVAGGTIGGGGTPNDGFGFAYTNRVEANFGTVGGGLANAVSGGVSTIGGGRNNSIQASSDFGTIGGGIDNTIQTSADFSTIAGGNNNTIETTASSATISGGNLNRIQANGDWATIGGGRNNTIETNAFYSSISGGWLNSVYLDTSLASIGGGFGNTVQTDADFSTIAGGRVNTVEARSASAVISGGTNNTVKADSTAATISGGGQNSIHTNSDFSTISGGALNTIEARTPSSVVGGGTNNIIRADAHASTISGGWRNTIHTNATYSTIGGGRLNTIQANTDGLAASTIGGGEGNAIAVDAAWATIGGGVGNSISNNAPSSTIAGGDFNTIGANSQFSAVGGGTGNLIDANATSSTIGGGSGNGIRANSFYATIGGGSGNLISTNADYSTVGGGRQNVIGTNSTYATIGGGDNNTIDESADYATIPGGRYAKATQPGQLAYANGRFADDGDAQTCVYVMRRTTTTTNTTELFLDGISRRLSLPLTSAVAFDILVVGTDGWNSVAAFQFRGVVDANFTPFMVGTPIKTTLGQKLDGLDWDAKVEAFGTDRGLVIQVNGQAGTPVRWVATVRTVEVQLPRP